MKKHLKARLTLNRETLRHLTADQMSEAQGGAVVPITYGTCPILITNACITQTCPTRCGQTYCYYV